LAVVIDHQQVGGIFTDAQVVGMTKVPLELLLWDTILATDYLVIGCVYAAMACV